MNKFLFTVILILALSSVSAKIYTDNEIQLFYASNELEQTHQNVIARYKQFSTVSDFIKNVSSDSNNELQSEYHLNGLLDYLSYQVKTPKNYAAVLILQKYVPQALKKHEEGTLNVPIYNIQAKAKGVENIWHMQEVQENVVNEIEKDFKTGLNIIKETLAEKHEAKTLGMKNSLKFLSKKSILQLSNYFINQIKQINGLEKYVVDFAIETNDKILINKLNTHLPKVNSEYLLRSVVKQFGEDYSIQQLIKHSQSGASKRFAISLLKPYVDTNENVQEFLILSLDIKQLSSISAFSLAQSQNQVVIDLLEKKYILSDVDFVKRNIRLSLKLSSHLAAKNLLKRIDMGEVK